MTGTYHVKHYRRGELLDSFAAKNFVTDYHKNSILTYFFIDAQQWIMPPFLGLINAGGQIASSDTWTSHPGWTENQSYKTYDQYGVMSIQVRAQCGVDGIGLGVYADTPGQGIVPNLYGDSQNRFLQGYPVAPLVFETISPLAYAIPNSIARLNGVPFFFTDAGTLDGCFLTNVQQKLIDFGNPYTGQRPEAIYSLAMFPRQIAFKPHDLLTFLYTFKVTG